jgi:hypothetical protein
MSRSEHRAGVRGVRIAGREDYLASAEADDAERRGCRVSGTDSRRVLPTLSIETSVGRVH